jgi:hypothetical protein
MSITCNRDVFTIPDNHNIYQSDWYIAAKEMSDGQPIVLHRCNSKYLELLLYNTNDFDKLNLEELVIYCTFLDFIMYNDNDYLNKIYFQIGLLIDQTGNLSCLEILGDLTYYLFRIYPGLLLRFDIPYDKEYKFMVRNNPEKYLSWHRYCLQNNQDNRIMYEILRT